MKTSIPRRCWLGVSLIASLASAQNQPASPPISEEAQKFLNVPVWYFNYTVTVKLNGTFGVRTESSERVMSGRMTLGLRSQGPSLSVITGDAKPPDLTSNLAAQQAQALAALGANADPQAFLAAVTQGLSSVTSGQVDQARSQFDAFVNDYANWIGGVNIDETKSEAENERILVQVREQNSKMNERYRWQYSDSDGKSRGSASGAGTALIYGEPSLEIDGRNHRFKLLFELLFNDSMQTVEAFRGVDEHGIGTIHYQRFEIKTGLHSGEQPITSITPDYKIIAGPLPGSFGNISGQSIHSIVKGGLPGTLSVQYSLSPHPPAPVEFIIEPPADYVRWQPMGDKDEKTAGDGIPIKVVLQKVGGGPPPVRPMKYTYLLWRTSREKGVCLNWPPNPDETLPFDLQFEQEENRHLLVEGNDRQVAVHTVPETFTDTVMVSCFDYGAHGEFAAVAELENGQVVHGVVKFTADQQELKLPFRPDGSIIASAFFDAHGLSGVGDDDDGERDPVGDGFTGDGLTLYEEYRGFMVGDEWMNADPKKKDLFVLNEMRGHHALGVGLLTFQAATRLKVHHLLRDNQVKEVGLINFNRTSGPHIVDQSAIRIQRGGLFATGNRIAQAGDVGTPGTAKTVALPPDLDDFLGENYMAATVAHEMLHACNVYHHGENDETVWWSYSPATNQFYESAVAIDTASGRMIGAGTAVPITVKREDGTVLAGQQFFAAGVFGRPVLLGLPHGLHSGHENCMMRYDIAEAYRSQRDPSVRYFTGRQSTGLALCSSPNGTGVNDAGRTPEPRFHSAATPQNGGPGILARRGDCIHQIRVNDLASEPKR